MVKLTTFQADSQESQIEQKQTPQADGAYLAKTKLPRANLQGASLKQIEACGMRSKAPFLIRQSSLPPSPMQIQCLGWTAGQTGGQTADERAGARTERCARNCC